MECSECFESKNVWFYVCENKHYILATIITKYANKFCYTYFNSLFSFCFSTFSSQQNGVNNFPIYAKEEVFLRGQFHKFPGFFAKVYQFANFKNSQMLLVIISKFILNFQLNFRKGENALNLTEYILTSQLLKE